MITLYEHPLSPYAQKVKIALREKGLEFTAQSPGGLGAGGVGGDFAKVSPRGEVPALVDGEVAGAINRVPAAGEARSNMHVGGRPEPTTLTPREKDICTALAPKLKERGLIFTGIDVIGDYLTEINVTSPTGIQEVKRFGGADIAALIWDVIERKRGK